MKKMILLSVILAFMVGCTTTDTTEVTNQVDNFFNTYQSVDSKVIQQLDEIIDLNTTLTPKQQEQYRNVMKRQYSDLTYTIKKESIEGNNAIVTCEVTVYDYGKVINNALIYLESNNEEFLIDDKLDNEKYNDYLLSQIENSSERITYTIDITLTKLDNNWIVDNLTENEREKINGTYYDR